MKLTPKETEQIERQGRDPRQAEAELDFFRTGFPFLAIAAPARVGSGIVRMTEQEIGRSVDRYDREAGGLRVVKFVPASGAASRMFKQMYEFVQEGRRSEAVDTALERIADFAFYPSLAAALPEGADDRTVAGNIVEGALGYGRAPKALILFHRTAEGPRTALEEHLVEGALYARGAGEAARLHFTISPEHESAFRERVAAVLPEYERRYGVKYHIDYSQQKPATDTIAVDKDNVPFTNEGKILFRPGGHGALLENLADLDADLVFIKTVDNVGPDRLKDDTVTYKKALAGRLLELQSRCFEALDALDGGVEEARLDEIAAFARAELAWHPAPDFEGKPAAERLEILRDRLDRPIRVCGMVRNEGEPGGGPFWVADVDGARSLQIAESSQIAPEQKPLMREATHFNPVDLVCGVRDRKGNKYDLRRFVDPLTGFISTKSAGGRELKALERPGLWNGAMARWNTIFVEVPITTFSPVKTVGDLLRPQHQ